MSQETFRYKLRQWRARSRDPGFLARTSLLILVVFGMAGVVVHAFVELPEEQQIELMNELLPIPEFDEGQPDDETTPPDTAPPEDRVKAPRIEAFEHLDAAREAGDWGGAAWWVTRINLMDIASPVLGLSIVAGAVWAIIAAQFAGFKPDQLALYGGGLVLGFISATLTLIVLTWQEMRGFVEGGDFTQQMIYWIGGVGLREEGLKLLCFAPLLIFLRRRADIDALVCGAMVGLGFAIHENVSYYTIGGVTGAFGRIVTANFLHMALTAFAARALFRFTLSPKRHWEGFLGTFITVVVVHGLYDAFISVPELEGFSLLSLVTLAVISFRFSALAGDIGRIGPGLSVSPVAVFVLGMAVLAGFVYLFCCLFMPPVAAALFCGMSLIGLFPIGVVHIYQLHRH